MVAQRRYTPSRQENAPHPHTSAHFILPLRPSWPPQCLETPADSHPVFIVFKAQSHCHEIYSPPGLTALTPAKPGKPLSCLKRPGKGASPPVANAWRTGVADSQH